MWIQSVNVFKANINTSLVEYLFFLFCLARADMRVIS